MAAEVHDELRGSWALRLSLTIELSNLMRSFDRLQSNFSRLNFFCVSFVFICTISLLQLCDTCNAMMAQVNDLFNCRRLRLPDWPFCRICCLQTFVECRVRNTKPQKITTNRNSLLIHWMNENILLRCAIECDSFVAVLKLSCWKR